ncbi:MAG: hypothetical protein Q9192_003091, partial [Flavoplaca navasiana]
HVVRLAKPEPWGMAALSSPSGTNNWGPNVSGHRGWIINTANIMGLVGQKVNGGKTCPVSS